MANEEKYIIDLHDTNPDQVLTTLQPYVHILYLEYGKDKKPTRLAYTTDTDQCAPVNNLLAAHHLSSTRA
ncbi:hypothetical protein C5B42_02925 [Candidatus Cerribacteria bacterium 'Amazon FNV 2010 28 9']|uniref:Uncharacterized protein n=1 Tax=Candidatus Cerribacteria bacterium 'Amazon FNV 2010 28 9' TaxID=2081795 RepID=A0A317JQ89_9BACT|nr:MAG: hypothetical protein C5B42_02925 [Candidatus Cerribacteria bacterium 'Amazon FNV 2010 28 9']